MATSRCCGPTSPVLRPVVQLGTWSGHEATKGQHEGSWQRA